MISEKAKDLAKTINKKRKQKEESKFKKEEEDEEEAKFMEKYKICPHCKGKVKITLLSFWKHMHSTYKCTKCGLKRNYFYGGD